MQTIAALLVLLFVDALARRDGQSDKAEVTEEYSRCEFGTVAVGAQSRSSTVKASPVGSEALPLRADLKSPKRNRPVEHPTPPLQVKCEQ